MNAATGTPRRARRAAAAAVAVGVLSVATVATAVPAPARTTTTTTGSAGTAATARGATATSIRVGGLGDASLYGGADVGARARFRRANDAGGVHGRTIDDVGSTDDGGDPDRGAAAARKLVEQDGVFAVVPVVTPELSAARYLARKRVPWFGWALSSDFCGSTYGFGVTGCPVPARVTSDAWPLLVSRVLPGAGASRAVAVVAEDTPSGRYDVAALRAAAQSVKLGVSYAKASLAVPASTDYAAVAKDVLTSNAGGAPDAVFVLGGTSNVLGVQQALVAAGYPGVLTNRLQYAPNLVAPAVGVFVYTPMAPVEAAADDPAMAQLVADVRKVAPDQPIDQSVVAGYWSADLFLAALQRAGRRLTPARFVRVADELTYRVANTVGPTTFPAAHSVPTPCGALVQSDGTAYVVKVPYSCGRVVPIK